MTLTIATYRNQILVIISLKSVMKITTKYKVLVTSETRIVLVGYSKKLSGYPIMSGMFLDNA